MAKNETTNVSQRKEKENNKKGSRKDEIYQSFSLCCS